MLVTASTIKDTLPNVRRFVTGNLAGGADHMFVFLDTADPEVCEYLDRHPHVTCVLTETSWWRGERPELLNVRQRINANVVKALLSTIPGVDWVFHVDADEIIQVDRAVLDTVPADTRVVKLETLEAVSRKSWDGDPTWFKRLLGKDDLTLLRALGVLARSSNGAYFHGHVEGKVGVRPALDVWLALHRGLDAAREELPAFEHEALRVLHYESFSVEEFVRKWTSILEAGPVAHFRPAREPTAVALRALMSKGLSEEQAAPYLMRIFEHTTEDDFETLRDLGLLVEVDPQRGTHQPAVFPALEEVRGLLERVATEPKLAFHPGEPVAAAQKVLDAITGG
ncbi:MAG TPA: glycosyltransferase family 2 protein [Nocardioides sp.]|nr:glycosyltransferase family 2 protein [Nocardioides sp.]